MFLESGVSRAWRRLYTGWLYGSGGIMFVVSRRFLLCNRHLLFFDYASFCLSCDGEYLVCLAWGATSYNLVSSCWFYFFRVTFVVRCCVCPSVGRAQRLAGQNPGTGKAQSKFGYILVRPIAMTNTTKCTRGAGQHGSWFCFVDVHQRCKDTSRSASLLASSNDLCCFELSWFEDLSFALCPSGD